ncbi:hypothetical protein AG1IA_02564 [Rhizoctonia solani AG-1 IA]|uniref:Uncharacterized protein n=1 Tax=Thanatephorus cucumeris (strain AG1-IA) TaxID=983506 RepID=L8WZI2_THACA|nr:hypothetical protein AG1IA_02564 [Rhizoctonia solani AG-1 IA]
MIIRSGHNDDTILHETEYKGTNWFKRHSYPHPSMPINALDKYYLALTALVTTGYQLLGFAIAWTLQFDKITDFTGGA